MKLKPYHCVTGLIVFFFSISISKSQIKPGDTLKFWSVAYIDWSPPSPPAQRQITAVCKKIGVNCYLFFDTTYEQEYKPNIADSLVSLYDTFIFPKLSSLYYPVSIGIDNDPKVFLLVTYGDGIWAGYFDPVQGMPDTMTKRLWNRHSSERDIIYTYKDQWENANIISHETCHLIEWGQDHSPEPISHPLTYWEEPWISEVFSTFGENYLHDDLSIKNVAHKTTSPSNDLSLIYFDEYEMRFIWGNFMYEHYGKESFLRLLLHDQANGITSVRNTLKTLGYKQSFEETFEEFVVANFIDDNTYLNGKYGYFHYNFKTLPNLFRILQPHDTIPVSTVIGDVRPYSAKYITFTSTTFMPIMIHFNGADNSKFRLSFILYNSKTNSTHAVNSFIPDSSNDFDYIVDSLGSAFYDQVIMAVINVDSSLSETQTATFNYSASKHNSTSDLTVKPSVNVNPNPATDFIMLNLNHFSGNSDLSIYNLLGNEIHHQSVNASRVKIDISSLPASTYFIYLKTKDNILIRKFLKN